MSAWGRWCVLTSQQSSSMLLTCALVFGHHVVAAFTFSSLCSFGEICNGWDLAKVGSYWECEGWQSWEDTRRERKGKARGQSRQHPVFPSGVPTKYSPGLTLLCF